MRDASLPDRMEHNGRADGDLAIKMFRCEHRKQGGEGEKLTISTDADTQRTVSMMIGDEVTQDMESTSNGSDSLTCLLDVHEEEEEEEDESDEIVILCELVGARDLVSQHDQGDGEPLKPYCIVRFGERIIHESKVDSTHGPNPIWTLSHQSMFLLRAKPREMLHSILQIGIYSQRPASLSARFKMKNKGLPLGYVTLNADDILSKCDRQRLELKLSDDMGAEDAYRGKLALRFQVATDSDQQVVRLFNQGLNLSKSQSRAELVRRLSTQSKIRPEVTLCTEIDESAVAQDSFVSALNNACSPRNVTDSQTGEKMVKVKPYPDPEREGETTFMLSNDVNMETRQPSHKWIDAGSGKLGKMYCDVLACHGLPNVDVGEFMGNVTDPFVCLVYEDACAMTDVIHDELSPHWLPWTQRAFCFGMMHPASVLYVGVFDYDLATSHEPLGRVAVNVSNLQKNTVHTLKYSLYPSSNVTERTAVGSITIRIRIDCPDDKAALLTALKPRPKIFVNVRKQKSFKVVRYTCYGEYDGEEKFDVTVMRSYINEIFEYKAAFGYAVADGFASIIFWRGQVEICSIMVPIYSLLFFCMAADFVERPYMFVPYFCFGVAGMMLGNLSVRRHNPSPWNRCPSFWHFIHTLTTGKAPTLYESINVNEGHEKALAYEKAWYDRVEQDLLLAEKRLKLQQELDKAGDDNISTKTSPSAIPVDILARLTRYQGMAGRYCGHMRFMKVILTWEESIVSFWITAVFLAVGLVTMILPWRFILTWTGRLVVWCFLGPHMKVVDWYQNAHKKDNVLNDIVDKFDLARARREDALKQKDMKAIAFGKYSTQVPSFNIGTYPEYSVPSVEMVPLQGSYKYRSLTRFLLSRPTLARHFDRPLPESSARICRQKPPKMKSLRRKISIVDLNENNQVCIPGQQLYGELIPRPEEEALLHEKELLRKSARLERFRFVVNRMIEIHGIDTTREILTMNTEESESCEPFEVGYEVVPDFDNSTTGSREGNRSVPKGVQKKRISVVMTADETYSSDVTREFEILLESDGKSVYEVK